MALPKSIQLDFVTPERVIVHEEVDEIELPGETGYFGVLPGHVPMLAALRPGSFWYRKGTEKKYGFIAAGLAEVLPDHVTVLAQIAERLEDIDIPRAEAAKRRAEERLTRAVPETDAQRAESALVRAVTRLNISRQRRPQA